MWYLVDNSVADAPRYWLGGISSSGRTIGRKNVHIRIKTPSVSRAHATIRVFESSAYSLLSENDTSTYVRSTAVQLEDTSAYGTFVKYPPDHEGERGGIALDTQTKLNKKIPAEIHPGAMLAFGAPTSWWTLQWYNVLCFVPDYETAKKTISAAAKGAGMEISSTFFPGITTHIVVSKIDITCFSILQALVNGLHIVTPAWLSSVQHTAKEACKLITEAQNNDAALAASKLAEEERFKPKFHDDTLAEYPKDVLDMLFSADAMKQKREDLFKDKMFAFVNGSTRSKWKDLLQAVGARTLVAGSFKTNSSREGMIIVEDSIEKGGRKKRNKEAGKITEKSIILALLAADSSYLVFDSPSEEKEAEENEDGKQNAVSEKEPAEKKTAATEKKKNNNTKPAVPDGNELMKKQKEITESIAVSCEEANERVFVKIKPPQHAPRNYNCTRTFSEHDVRRFRRKNLPHLNPLPMKRVRYMEEEDEFLTPSKNVAAARKKKGGNGKNSSIISDVDPELSSEE